MASTWHFLGAAIEADWLEAWAAAVGSVGTVGTLIYAARGLKRERIAREADVSRLRNEQLSKEEAQARTVIVHQPVCSGIQFQKIDEVVVSINNYGDAPILSLTARIWWENMPYGEGDWRQQKYPDTIRVIEAGGDTRLAWSVEIPWPEGVSLESIQRGINCEVTYTDTHGLMWTRGEQGDLRRVH